MACYNCYKFIWRGGIHQAFIVLFYILTIFCLGCWLYTAIAQACDVDTRYLVYQKIDDPEPYQVATDISQVAFLALFALCSATMYHIDQSLSLLLPGNINKSMEKV